MIGNNSYHYSVMLKEVKEYLSPVLEKEGSVFIDATLGEGGHSYSLLESNPFCEGIGLEADDTILRRAEERISPFISRFHFFNGWSHDFFKNEPKEFFNAILMDLGISTYHYHYSGRGFTFTGDEPLDMRLNREDTLQASDIINTYKEKDLADLFFDLGEERYSRLYAKAIVKERSTTPIMTTKDLRDIIWKVAPNRYGKIHPATKVFQALRIKINGELEKLESLLRNASLFLSPGGRLAVITFHSLEDRIVKHTFRNIVKDENSSFLLVSKKAINPSEEEVKENSPSRSAKMRILERKVI